jgi:hypothetical protein
VSGSIPPLPPSYGLHRGISTLFIFSTKIKVVYKMYRFFSVPSPRINARSPTLTRLNSPPEASVLCAEREDSSPCSQDAATGHT